MHLLSKHSLFRQLSCKLGWDTKSPFFPVQPSLLQILMPPLQEKWASISDTDRELQPLFECFTSLATALGQLPLLQVLGLRILGCRSSCLYIPCCRRGWSTINALHSETTEH